MGFGMWGRRFGFRLWGLDLLRLGIGCTWAPKVKDLRDGSRLEIKGVRST